MTIKIKHPCTFQNGKPILKNVEAFRKECLSFDGKEGDIVIHKKTTKKPKSLKQLKYYWGVIIPILGDHFGYLKDEMHSALGYEFLLVYQENGLHYVKSTAMHKWTTGEWEDYCSKIRTWASIKFNVFIPLPNEIDYDSLPEYY